MEGLNLGNPPIKPKGFVGKNFGHDAAEDLRF
jgi:hypothetical protein